ncbi:MAG TPA: hypothetical protein VNN22_16405 [Verrucomicrobiae bacterium]|nr:hypothetical protein [Verrucomicrobiae bacterium]
MLTPFATFGNTYLDSNVTINGDVGISANGTVNVMAPSTINGNLYLAAGATKIGPGAVTGSTFLNQNLTAAQQQVFTASTLLASLVPGTLGSVVVPAAGVVYGAVNGIVDITVINVDNLTSGGGNITFTGDVGDYFVLNIAHDLDMTGSAAIIGGLPGHLLVNLWDTTPENLGVIAHVGNVINGTTLIPYDSATFHSVNGAIYSGYGEITLMSGATVDYVPYTPPSVPDAASTALLALIGLGSLTVYRKMVVA